MLAWLRDLTSPERRTMLACWGGWTLDGFDQQLYSYVVPTVIAVWGMSTGAALSRANPDGFPRLAVDLGSSSDARLRTPFHRRGVFALAVPGNITPMPIF
jgi:hypothetical protein